MTLPDYVGIGRKDTFVQYVENKTKPLGSIGGMDSSKFGIWERRDPSHQPGRFANVGKYSWPRRLPFATAAEVFAAIKTELLSIVAAARTGNFAVIDRPGILVDFFKWKVAFLYSNERLIPIFSRDVLAGIAQGLGLPGNPKKLPVWDIQQAMVAGKPFGMNIYQYARHLLDRYPSARQRKHDHDQQGTGQTGRRRNTRKASTGKNTGTLSRKGTGPTTVNQEHNRLQEILRARLEAQYGKDNVLLEHNYVDLKVRTPEGNVLYEVKSAAYASDCVEEALGQVLRYAFHHRTGQEDAVALVVAGKFPPNESDSAYIAFVTGQLNIRFSYMAIE
ncbi:hypothetical protein DCC81_03535 [Chitinophaga parva]|uniref:Protein NO VEIN C-terminal domain-containing protein n=2 Tax=Chitinophaga parva TaxID=2169414 RepID=A0A2T7BLN3_9BACT|nr:hypothetical protein DCC81_03535 [Chitinophaga parva]